MNFFEISLCLVREKLKTIPFELVSMDSGFCTTLSIKCVVRKPSNHRDELGGALIAPH
jgi:hypothetical protein